MSSQFAVPTLICIKNKDRADLIDETLKKIDFVADGIHLTDSEFLKCIDDPEGFDFIKWKSGKVKTIPARQYVHRSGALFIRLIRDQKGWGILAGIENHRHASKENGFRDIAKAKLREISRATTLNRPTGAD